MKFHLLEREKPANLQCKNLYDRGKMFSFEMVTFQSVNIFLSDRSYKSRFWQLKSFGEFDHLFLKNELRRNVMFRLGFFLQMAIHLLLQL